MRRIVNIDPVLTERLLKEVLPMLPPRAAEIVASSTVKVCRRRKGWGSSKSRIALIPDWAFGEFGNFCGKGLIPLGLDFVAYYLAHELAHIEAGTNGHGPAFYTAFKALCPTRLQHYELTYKPQAAARAGVRPA